jgi:uncharacterized protein
MLRIRTTHLKPGVHHVALEPAADELDLDPARFTGVRVNARLDLFGERVLVHFDVEAVATLECDRTLNPFEYPVQGEHTLLFSPPDLIDESEQEIGDVRVLAPTEQEIDLTEAVRDTILLAIPARRVAPGAEDIEIPTQFGAPDEVVDPRWAALTRLRNTSGESSPG